MSFRFSSEGTRPDCSDAVACTLDACNEATDNCDHTPDDAACDDTLFCTGLETCHPTLGCQPGTPPDCSDQVACTVDSCNETTDSCDHAPDDAACSDSQFCNGVEACDVSLGCQPGLPPSCDDSVACTDDACNESTDACEHNPNDAACNDNQFCNGAESCHVALGCQSGQPVDCSMTVHIDSKRGTYSIIFDIQAKTTVTLTGPGAPPSSTPNVAGLSFESKELPLPAGAYWE